MSFATTRMDEAEASDENPLIDITALVEECAASLTYSQPLLCNERTFSLQDSMAALELMDGTMDCCQLPATSYCRGSVLRQQEEDSSSKSALKAANHAVDTATMKTKVTIAPRNRPKGLHDPKCPLPWTNLTINNARVIGAEILSRLESMLTGACVAESTYTCLYAHDGVLSDMKSHLGWKDAKDSAALSAAAAASAAPATSSSDIPTPQQYAVYASALGLVKSSELVRTIIQHADIYEEEDFSINSYCFRFFPEVREDDVPTALLRAMSELQSVKKKSTGLEEEVGEEDNNKKSTKKKKRVQDDDIKDVEALHLMLGFLFDFFRACTSLAKLTSASVKVVASQTKKVIQLAVSKLEKLHSLLTTEFVDASDSDDDDKRLLLLQTFDSYINRTLLGNAPVRKVKFQCPIDSITTLITIVSQLDWAVCDLLLRGNTLARIKRMLHHVSISSVNILSRSFIVLNLYFDDLLLGQYHLGGIIAQHMQQAGGIPQVLNDAEYGRTFLTRLGKPIYDTLKLLVLNRNRQRAYIEAVMMREWGVLLREASAVDFYFREEHNLGTRTPAFVTNYLLSTTVWLMEHYVGLGIELHLFHGHYDLSIAYWYLDYLLSTLTYTIAAMRKAKYERLALEEQIKREEEKKTPSLPVERPRNKKKGGKHQGKKGSSNGGEKRAGAKDPSAVTPTKEDFEDNIDFMLLGLRRTLCRGIVRFIAALNQAELLRPPVYEFTSHERRFQKRFELFTVIQQPPILTYDDFRKGSDFSRLIPSDLITSATECFKASKTVIDQISAQMKDIEEDYLPIRRQELVNLTKVCVGNSIYLLKLAQEVKSGGKVEGEVSLDFDTHKQFCSIKIK